MSILEKFILSASVLCSMFNYYYSCLVRNQKSLLSTTDFNVFSCYSQKILSSIYARYKPVYSLWKQWSRV